MPRRRSSSSITYLTEGLRRVLTTAVQRLAGAGGDPVIGLQTAFGGGKTHTMLALYHLAKHLPRGRRSARAGRHERTARQGRRGQACRSRKIAVFVGSVEGPDVSLKLKGSARPHALGLYRLAARGRSGTEARRGSRGRPHESRLGAAGRSCSSSPGRASSCSTN